MSAKLNLTVSVTIQAPKSKVWEAVTNPEMIKKYLFGTETRSDWKVGSPITFSGVWDGKAYEDKGTILEIEKEKILKYNYWSNFSGEKDEPANYSNITYTLSSGENGSTIFTLTQDNIKSQESKDHSEKNWTMVLNTMKDLLER
jgi:uncharacterized protein YndB with AHSA1/START domain